MNATLLAPISAPLAALPAQLASDGWAVIAAAALGELCHLRPASLQQWQSHWPALPPDPHLRDGGHYRRRRHGCFVVTRQGAQAVPHRAHWQPVEYNALHGGYQRWFDPLPEALAQDPAWARLLQGLAGVADTLRSPIYSTAVGLVQYGAHYHQQHREIVREQAPMGKYMKKLQNFFARITGSIFDH